MWYNVHNTKRSSIDDGATVVVVPFGFLLVFSLCRLPVPCIYNKKEEVLGRKGEKKKKKER
jgi:hypothetical protein